jgi:hypothetical protein
MNIQGLDYNTQREALVLPEYGREIQKMVDHAIQLPTKEERTLCAKAIIKQMENKVPQIRENANYQQTLWDHLYLMSHKQLDIDWPNDLSNVERMNAKPEPMKLPQTDIRLRHYGRLVEEMLDKLKDMADGPQRDELIRLTANQMKRDLIQWGHGSIDDEKVADDMARLTDGVIQINLNVFRFASPSQVMEPGLKRNNKKRK